MTADPLEEYRAILGVPHLDRPDLPHGGFSSGFETLAELVQQLCRGLSLSQLPLLLVHLRELRRDLSGLVEPAPALDARQRTVPYLPHEAADPLRLRLQHVQVVLDLDDEE